LAERSFRLRQRTENDKEELMAEERDYVQKQKRYSKIIYLLWGKNVNNKGSVDKIKDEARSRNHCCCGKAISTY
jgi:hypothetical protein